MEGILELCLGGRGGFWEEGVGQWKAGPGVGSREIISFSQAQRRLAGGEREGAVAVIRKLPGKALLGTSALEPQGLSV